MEYLFTNILLELIINISCESLFGNEVKQNNFRRNDFEKPLRITLQNNFNFDVKSIHKLKQIWLNECPDDFKLVYYSRYVDDTFPLFCSPDHLQEFTNHLNSKHKNIKLTYEKESNILLIFLDILISRSENSFEISVYQKPTSSGVILTSIVSFTSNIKLI